MLFNEPPQSPGDLRFRVAGIPVRVHVFFWIACLLLMGIGGGEVGGTELVCWVVTLFLSILVHELGHGFVQRYYGGHPHIVLHGMGGLAICGDCDRSPRSQILISFAGPAAGFCLAGVVILLLALTGQDPRWSFSGERMFVDAAYYRLWVVLGYIGFLPIANDAVLQLVENMLYINIFWGLVNLLPIYPLDGGQIARELFTLRGNTRVGIIRSLQLSIVVAVAMAIWGLKEQKIFVVILFGLLAYGSYQSLERYRDDFGSRNRW